MFFISHFEKRGALQHFVFTAAHTKYGTVSSIYQITSTELIVSSVLSYEIQSGNRDKKNSCDLLDIDVIHGSDGVGPSQQRGEGRTKISQGGGGQKSYLRRRSEGERKRGRGYFFF